MKAERTVKRTCIGLFIVLVAAASAAASAAGSAVAAEATAEIELRHRVIGTIVLPGDSHDLTFFAPQGTVIKPKVKREDKKNDPEATLFLTDPDGTLVGPLEVHPFCLLQAFLLSLQKASGGTLSNRPGENLPFSHRYIITPPFTGPGPR